MATAHHPEGLARVLLSAPPAPGVPPAWGLVPWWFLLHSKCVGQEMGCGVITLKQHSCRFLTLFGLFFMFRIFHEKVFYFFKKIIHLIPK